MSICLGDDCLYCDENLGCTLDVCILKDDECEKCEHKECFDCPNCPL